MISIDEIIGAGKFFKPHGLKGEINVLCDYESDILNQGYPIIVDIDGIFVPFYAESIRAKHFAALMKLDGVDSKEDVSRFVNKEFYLMRRDVSEYLDIPEDELQQELDLIGYKVFDKHAGYVGEVTDIQDVVDYILLEVTNPETNDVYNIPFVDEFIEGIENIDDNDKDETDEQSAKGEIHFNLPEGMLEINKN